MDPLLQLDLQLILWFQQVGAWLSAPMKLLSLLGTEDAFMAIMPMLYWCVDAGIGLRIGLMLLLSNALNAYFKLAFHSPRPYWYDARVQGLSTETSFGMPSGHAQNAASIWGLFGVEFLRRWKNWAIPILLAVLIVLIGVSRLYLGVHFLADVLAGWAIGLALLWAFTRLEPKVSTWLKTRPLNTIIGLNVLLTLAMIVIMLAFALPLQTWQLPALWAANALTASPDPIQPLNLQGIFTIGGTWLGVTCGAAWYYRRYGALDMQISLTQRLLRYIVGIAGLWIIYLGLGSIFPRTDDLLGYGLRFFRYTLIGLWVSAAAPLIFSAVGLSRNRRGEPKALKEKWMEPEGG